MNTLTHQTLGEKFISKQSKKSEFNYSNLWVRKVFESGSTSIESGSTSIESGCTSISNAESQWLYYYERKFLIVIFTLAAHLALGSPSHYSGEKLLARGELRWKKEGRKRNTKERKKEGDEGER